MFLAKTTVTLGAGYWLKNVVNGFPFGKVLSELKSPKVNLSS